MTSSCIMWSNEGLVLMHTCISVCLVESVEIVKTKEYENHMKISLCQSVLLHIQLQSAIKKIWNGHEFIKMQIEIIMESDKSCHIFFSITEQRHIVLSMNDVAVLSVCFIQFFSLQHKSNIMTDMLISSSSCEKVNSFYTTIHIIFISYPIHFI